METVTSIVVGIALLPFFLLDALEHTEKKIGEDLNKVRIDRAEKWNKSERAFKKREENLGK